MLAPFLMGLVGGQRSMTPLAMIAVAAARGDLPEDSGAPRILGHPAVAAGLVALALGELAGDKQRSAPDRIVPIGLLARFITNAIAGAALSPRERRVDGAAVAGVTAVAASFPGWYARITAIERHGQVSTGVLEDAAVLAGGAAILRAVVRDR